MPILLFIGIGAMIDFGPLLANPKLFLCGAAAQAGIFLTIIIACALGFDLKDAASIGIIGAADGPTSILVSQTLDSKFVAPSPWPPTPIWPWCPLSSPSPSSWSPPRRSGPCGCPISPRA